MRIAPHARTLRKARMQVQLMVHTGSSARQIRGYLNRFIHWRVNSSETWKYDELLLQFIKVCWDKRTAAYAAAMLDHYLKQSRSYETNVDHDLLRVSHLSFAVAA